MPDKRTKSDCIVIGIGPIGKLINAPIAVSDVNIATKAIFFVEIFIKQLLVVNSFQKTV